MSQAVEFPRHLTTLHRIGLLLATGFGAGQSPIAPGTVGSIEGVALYVALSASLRLSHVGNAVQIVGLSLVTVFVVIAGIWAANLYCDHSGVKDPQQVVVDEIAGQMIALLPLGTNPTVVGVIAGLLLFRIFDIVKPYPARRLEYLPRGQGVMLDDLMAGVYAAALVLAGRLAHVI